MKKWFVLPVALLVLFFSAPNLAAAAEEDSDMEPTFFVTPVFLNVGAELRQENGDFGYKTSFYDSATLSLENIEHTYGLDNTFVGVNFRFGSFSDGMVGAENTVITLTYLQGLDGTAPATTATVLFPQAPANNVKFWTKKVEMKLGKIFEAAFSHNFWVGNSVAFNAGFGWDYKRIDLGSTECNIYDTLGTTTCPAGARSFGYSLDMETPYVSGGMYFALGSRDRVTIDIKGMFSNWASVNFTDIYYMPYNDTVGNDVDVKLKGKDKAQVIRGTAQVNFGITEHFFLTIGGEIASFKGSGEMHYDSYTNSSLVGSFKLRNSFDADYYGAFLRLSYSMY